MKKVLFGLVFVVLAICVGVLIVQLINLRQADSPALPAASAPQASSASAGTVGDGQPETDDPALVGGWVWIEGTDDAGNPRGAVTELRFKAPGIAQMQMGYIEGEYVYIAQGRYTTTGDGRLHFTIESVVDLPTAGTEKPYYDFTCTYKVDGESALHLAAFEGNYPPGMAGGFDLARKDDVRDFYAEYGWS